MTRLRHLLAAAVPAVMLPSMAAAQPAAEPEPPAPGEPAPPPEEDVPPGVRFAWVRGAGAETCPAVELLEAEVEKRLGRNPFSEEGGRSIEAVVAREGTHWVARVYVRDQRGVLLGDRVITDQAPGCQTVSGAIALAVALAIQHMTKPPPPPVPAPASPPQPAPPMLKPWDRAPGVAIRGVVARGLLPGVAAGLSLSVDGPSRGRVRWTLGAIVLPEVGTADQVVGFGMAAGWIGVCLEAARGLRVGLRGCTGPVGGIIHTFLHGIEVFEPVETGDRGWLAWSAGAQVTMRMGGPAVVELGAEGLVPIKHNRFEIDGRTVFQQEIIALMGYLGVGVRFR